MARASPRMGVAGSAATSSPHVGPSLVAAATAPLRVDDVREALLALTGRDVAVLHAALTVLDRATDPGSMFLPQVLADSGIQRLAFFLAAVGANASALKSNVDIVELGCAVLAKLLEADPSGSALVAKECGSRVFAGLLKAHFPLLSLAHSVTSILLAVSKHERNYGLVARLDGGIHMLLQLLQSPTISRRTLLQCITLLGVYAKGSDNNVHLVAKKGGLLVASNLVKVHLGDNEVVAAVFTLLGHVAAHPKHSAALGDLGVCESVATLLSLRTTDHTLAEAALGLVLALADVATNVTRMWNAGTFQVIWLVVSRFGTEHSALLKTTSAAMWKLLAARGVGYCVDLNGLHRWELPVYPAERGCQHAAALIAAATADAAAASAPAGEHVRGGGAGGGDASSGGSVGAGGGSAMGAAARQLSEAMAHKASEGKEEGSLRDLFPEHDPAASAAGWAPPEVLVAPAAGVVSTSHGVRSVIPFKVPWPSCPSVLQAASNNAYAPVTSISDSQRTALVQFMVLSVIARLMNRRAAGVGALVYDRYTAGVSGGGDLLPLRTQTARGSRREHMQRGMGIMADASSSTYGYGPAPHGQSGAGAGDGGDGVTFDDRGVASDGVSLTTGDPEADALLFYAADEAESQGSHGSAHSSAGAAGASDATGSHGEGDGAGSGDPANNPLMASDASGTVSRHKRSSSAGPTRAIRVRVPGARSERGLGGGDGGGDGDGGSTSEGKCATVGLSLDPEAYTVDRILQRCKSEEKEWDSVPPLRFESRFECGNLRAAVRVAPREYDLVLAPDINNGGHTQWFYFHVRDFQCGDARYRFNIVNLEKKDSTYNYGMRPLMYCTFVDEMKVCGWQRVGDDICYFQNHFTKHSHGNKVVPVPAATPAAVAAAAAASAVGGVAGAGMRGVESSSSITSMGSVTDDAGQPPRLINMYTATFSVQFPEDARGAFVAYCYPYSFTDLMLDVREWDDRAERVGRNEFVAVTKLVSPAPVSATLLRRCATTRTSVLRRTVLCQTLAGNPVPLLTITNFASPQADIDARPYIVLSGRVHPGETNASWMMRGVLDFLTSSAREADLLRDLAIFKVVPFLNPDGVINGHHRCNLSGEDLNRHWTAPVKGGTPTVFYTKKLLALCKRRRVSVFCDFHGHSRKKNIFMFGCENSDGTPERVFPRLLDRCAPDFSYKSCSFAVQKSKANCARVAVWRDLNITNSYTIEASFCGADQGPNKDVHFTPRNYEEMGHHFCCALLDMLLPDTTKLAEVMLELQQMHPSKFIGGGGSGASDSRKGKKGGKKKRGRTPTRKADGGSSSTSGKRSSSAGSGNGSSSSAASSKKRTAKASGSGKGARKGSGRKLSGGVASQGSRRSGGGTGGKGTRKRPPRT